MNRNLKIPGFPPFWAMAHHGAEAANPRSAPRTKGMGFVPSTPVREGAPP